MSKPLTNPLNQSTKTLSERLLSIEVERLDLETIIRSLREEVAQSNLLLEQVMARLQNVELHAPSWRPPATSNLLPDELINIPQVTRFREPERASLSSRLKATFLGNYYTKHLKKYSLIRGPVNCIWNYTYPRYIRYLDPHLRDRVARRWRPLIQLSEFVKSKGLPVVDLVNLSSVETPDPQVFPKRDQSYLSSQQDYYDLPTIYATTISEGIVYGGTNLVLAENKVVCHDLYDFNRDSTSEELHGRALIDPGRNRIRWLSHDKKPETMRVGASFVDATATNYAHWISEVLPRIALFCADEQFHGIPIIVNAGLHKNIMASLFLLAGDRHEIKALPIGRALIVAELYLISVTGYVPFGRRENELSNNSHGKFNPSALKLLHDSMHTFLGHDNTEGWPQKIYLRRDSGTRLVTNEADLEMVLNQRGYVTIEPEGLTFLQQVNLFSNTKIILASTGAALSNAIFCRPETQVAILMAKHEHMIYRYWCDMLSRTGIGVSYVLGKIVENTDLGIHADFEVNISDVKDLLDTMEKK